MAEKGWGGWEGGVHQTRMFGIGLVGLDVGGFLVLALGLVCVTDSSEEVGVVLGSGDRMRRSAGFRCRSIVRLPRSCMG